MLECNISIAFLLLTVVDAQRPDCSEFPQSEDIKTCCEIPDILKDDENGIIGICAESYQDSTTEEKMQIESCFVECMWNETEFLENGEINVEAARNFFNETFENDADFVDILTDSLDSCIPYAKERAKVDVDIPEGFCSPYLGILATCLYSTVFVNCPVDQWRGNEECDNVREHVKYCDVNIFSLINL